MRSLAIAAHQDGNWDLPVRPEGNTTNHQKCWAQYRASKAYSEQGCKAHRINYHDSLIHYTDGKRTHDTWRCYHDIYCEQGEWWQRASRKGLIDYDELKQLRRCAENPRKIAADCEPITDELLSQDAQQYPQ